MTAVLLSGQIATGKTAAAGLLATRLNARLLLVRGALAEVLGIEARDRQTLQRRGADLDRRTNGRWLRDYIEERVPQGDSVIVDALRTRKQTLPILESRTDSRLVFLEAHEHARRERYAVAARTDVVKASVDFDTAMHHPTETEVQRLRPMAHLVLATDDFSIEGVVTEVVRSLGLAP